MRNFLSVRFKAIAKEKFIAEVNHSLRLHSFKSTNNQINQNPNYFYNEDSQEWETYTNNDLKKFGDKTKNAFSDKVEKHRELHKANRKINGNVGFKEFDKSLSMFVFTFSEKMKTDFLEYQRTNNHVKIKEILSLGRKTAEDIAKHFNNEIMYITFHTDEKGIPHFQGMATNYNKENGKKLNIQTNVKNGEICQDIIAENFEPIGHIRGVSKKETKTRHLSTEQYKIEQDLKKENEKLKAKNQALKSENHALKLEFKDTINQIVLGLEQLGEQTTVDKFLKTLARYLKGEAKGKIEKLISKYLKVLAKKQKENNKKVAQSNIDFVNKSKASDTNTTTTKTTSKKD